MTGTTAPSLLRNISTDIAAVIVIENMTAKKLTAPLVYLKRGELKHQPIEVGPWRREIMAVQRSGIAFGKISNFRDFGKNFNRRIQQAVLSISA